MNTQIAELTPEQTAELTRLTQYFPFRYCYAVLAPDGSFLGCFAQSTKRGMNQFCRNGNTVLLAK